MKKKIKLNNLVIIKKLYKLKKNNNQIPKKLNYLKIIIIIIKIKHYNKII